MMYQLDIFDLRNILDSIPYPCFVVDINTRKLQTGNFLFMKFSEYSIDEISNSDFKEFLIGFDLANAADGEIQKAIIQRKSGEQSSVELIVKYFSINNNLMLVTLQDLIDKEFIEDKSLKLDEDIFGIIEKLPDCGEEELFKQIVNVCLENHLADDIVFYLNNPKQQKLLKRISWSGSNFPAHIPEIELARITETDIWQPGKRVLSEIHRAGREFKYQTVYCIPIGKKPIGLIVIGFKTKLRDEHLDFTISHYSLIIDSLIGLASEYTNLIKKNQEMIESTEKFATGYDNSSDAILVLDEENNVLDFNSRLSEVLQYLPIEIKNRNAVNIFGNIDILNQLNTIPEYGKTQVTRRINVNDRSGKSHTMDIWGHHYFEGPALRKMVFFRDVTENQKLEDLLTRMEKQALLGETISEFAHDVRNIINRQSTGIQLLAKKMRIQIEDNKEISGLLEDCENLTDLMESVLSFSRQDSNRFEKILLADFIQNTVYRNKYKAEKTGITVQFNNRLPSTEVLGDQRSLERVLNNLINNAIEANKKEGGTVSVTLMEDEPNSDFVVIKIADTGPGIPEGITKVLLTDQFTDKDTGTGLGLLISNKIVEAHKGHIQLDSFAGGTIFSIYLPRIKTGVKN